MRTDVHPGRAFRGLWAATASANLADGVALFALPLLALAVGASPGGVAAVTIALTLAWPVFGLHAGWIVDQVGRRSLLVSVNVVRAGVLLALTLAYASDRVSLGLVLVAALVLGVAETLVDTALTSTIPQVVAPEDRSRANGRIEATINLTNQMAGPPLAGALAGVTLAAATGVSALLYATTLVGLGAVRLRRQPQPDSGPRPTKGVGAGLRYLWRHPVLRSLTLFTAAMNVVWAAAVALLVVYAVRPGPLGLTAAQYGLMLTAMAVGGLAASVAVEPLRRRLGVQALLVADCVGTILLVAPVAVGATAWLVAAGAVVAGAGASIWRVLLATIRQNLTPPDVLGRVYAASRVISWGVIPGGAALAGIVAELWSVRTVFVASTAVAIAVLVAFVGFAMRHDLSAALDSDQLSRGS
ncbi:MAG: MFS transporter [Jiangellaceae bacterium]